MCNLESERLILRPPRPVDIQSMTVWLSDYDVARMTARVPHPYGESDAEAFVAAGSANRFVIERKSDGVVHGDVKFAIVHEFVDAWRVGEVRRRHVTRRIGTHGIRKVRARLRIFLDIKGLRR